jgi:hypothetical protein
LYIAGTEDDTRQIEFTLGMNDSIRLGQSQVLQNPGGSGYKDYIRFHKNTAHNYQSSLNSEGAHGGAIYVGRNTSLIIAGEFTDNSTHAKYLVDETGRGLYNLANEGHPTPYNHGILYSTGGAIASEPVNAGRIQIRGDRDKDAFRKRASD